MLIKYLQNNFEIMTTATIVNGKLVIPFYVQEIINKKKAWEKISSFSQIILDKFLEGLSD